MKIANLKETFLKQIKTRKIRCICTPKHFLDIFKTHNPADFIFAGIADLRYVLPP